MSDVEFKGNCDEARERFNLNCDCCDSCHDDDANGYEMCYLVLEGMGEYYYVCCAVKNAYDDMVRSSMKK